MPNPDRRFSGNPQSREHASDERLTRWPLNAAVSAPSAADRGSRARSASARARGAFHERAGHGPVPTRGRDRARLARPPPRGLPRTSHRAIGDRSADAPGRSQSPGGGRGGFSDRGGPEEMAWSSRGFSRVDGECLRNSDVEPERRGWRNVSARAPRIIIRSAKIRDWCPSLGWIFDRCSEKIFADFARKPASAKRPSLFEWAWIEHM